MQEEYGHDDDSDGEDDWVQCDNCDNWYHINCAEVEWPGQDTNAQFWYCC